MELEGNFVALVTPFAGGTVDVPTLRDLVDFQLQNGTRGFCPVGTTGEAPTLTRDEKATVVRTVVEMTRGKALVFAGTGSYDTRGTIETTKMARELGADGALVVTPYYNKPTQEGLFRHYEAVAKATPLPIILYNVPGRTGVSLAPETTARLSKLPNIVGLKDASNQIEQVTIVRGLCDIQILSGEDSLTFSIMALGGRGVISVAANVVPKEVNALCAAARSGDLDGARKVHERLFPLFKGLFLEANPIPVKTALKMMGKGNGELRLPLCGMSAAPAEQLRGILKALSVL